MKGKKSFRLMSSLLLMGAVAVAGCKKSDTGANGEKKLIKVGFSQIGAESDWRTANTKSVKDALSEANGIDLRFSDAQQKQENQIQALRAFLAQKVDVIILAPVTTTGFEPVLRDIKAAHIPVILSDRRIDPKDDDLYTTYVGSDVIHEGNEAGEWLATKMGGKANIAELTGTTGSAPAIARAKGFRDAIAKYPDMKIIMSQTGDFSKSKGQEVMEGLLKSPQGKDITAVYAHNDDMALGAIQAIKAAGLKPGKDIVLISVDGTKNAFQSMVDGDLSCTVECNPLIGQQLLDAVKDISAGKEVPKWIPSKESMFDQSQAAAALPSRQY